MINRLSFSIKYIVAIAVKKLLLFLFTEKCVLYHFKQSKERYIEYNNNNLFFKVSDSMK